MNWNDNIMPEINFDFQEEPNAPTEINFELPGSEKPETYLTIEGIEMDYELIKSLFAAMIKLQNLHWAAPSNAYHTHIDEFNDIVKSFIDDFAENVQGIYGSQFAPACFGDSIDITFSPSISTGEFSEYIFSVLSVLEGDITTWWENRKDNFKYEGVRNAAAAFIENIHKYNYLFKIDSREK